MNPSTTSPSIVADDLDLLHADLRDGRSFVATFRGPRGLAALEVMGPKGMRQDASFLKAPVRTLRLWVAGRLGEPEAVAVADDGLDASLQAIEDHARTFVDEDEAPALGALLNAVRRSVRGRKPRAPTIGECVTETGTPSFEGWVSCLSLGDLERVLRASMRPLEPDEIAQAA